MRNRLPRAATPAALAGQREIQLVMLVEALMLGHTVVRKAHHAS